MGTHGMEFASRAYLTCADVFDAVGESELARAAVEEGYHELIQRADKISNADWRTSFLENVPEHRTLVERWALLVGSPMSHSKSREGE